MLDNAPNQPAKLRTENWTETNADPRGTYNTINRVKFKTSMLKSSLFDYNDACIHASGTITVTGAGDNDVPKRPDERIKEVIFKNFASFTDCISSINNTQIDVVMLVYDLIEYNDNYSKTQEVYGNIIEMSHMII